MLYVAAALLWLLGVAHSLLGERLLLIPLFREQNDSGLLRRSSLATQTLRFAWHLTTLAWWCLAALLVLAAGGQFDRRSILAVIGYAMFASGLLPLVLTRGRHLAWAVLFVIGTLTLFVAHR